jgi:predicted nucleic acid-binding protein
MSGSAFLDTNVVVYAFDDDEPVKQERARTIIGGGDYPTLVVSTQVLAEFFVTVTRKLDRPLSPELARQAVADLATLPVVGADKESVLAGIDLADRHQLCLWDALIVQAAATAGCETLLTEDLTDGTVLAGVSIQNPFAQTPTG